MLDARGERLRAIQSSCAASSAGSVRTIRSVSSSPPSLRIAFTAWIRSRDAALELELVVERGVERDGEAVLAGDRPALARRARSTSTSSGSSSWPVDAQPAAVELLELAGLERRPHGARARCRAAGRARGRFGFSAQLGRLDRRRTRPPSRAARRAISSACAASRVGAVDDDAGAAAGGASRPACARAWRPSSTTRRTSAISASSAASGSPASGQPARCTESGAPSQTPATRFRQRCVGEERHHRRDHAQRLDERVPERPERGLVAVPEAAARAADVPVGEIVDERARTRA